MKKFTHYYCFKIVYIDTNLKLLKSIIYINI